MKNDVFEQCYQFNMKRNSFKRDMLSAYSKTRQKVLFMWHKQLNHDFDEFGNKLPDYIDFVFWNNHPYWAWLLHEEFNELDFLNCAKTVRKIAYTYCDLPAHTGLINYDMYQVAPSFC